MSPEMKLLLAEDTVDMNRVITAVLQHEKYEVTSVFDGEQALENLRKDSYDAIILDIMMPKKDGMQVLRELREAGDVTPVLMLTAKAEIDDRVAGLDAGADDYLVKPFAMKELLARVRSLVRRRAPYGQTQMQFEDLTLDPESFEMTSENTVRLSIKEFELMQTLMLHPGRELSTDYLLEHVWNGEENAKPDTVWLYISYLRNKLGAIASHTSIIGARGESYRLEAAGTERK